MNINICLICFYDWHVFIPKIAGFKLQRLKICSGKQIILVAFFHTAYSYKLENPSL